MNGLSLPHLHSGKVRDTYRIPGHLDVLLMVASDRISTHNVKHRTLVKTKGELLTALTVFWTLDVLKGVSTHLIAFGKRIYNYHIPRDDPTLHYRAMVVRHLNPDPREFIWRNFLTGSLEVAYKEHANPYGLNLPPGLPKMSRFEPPLFTPTLKSEDDEPVNSSITRDEFLIQTILTGQAFKSIGQYLRTRGIALVDGKFETDHDTLIDEWGTGDCCRMAFLEDIQEGVDPPWLDKEVFRQAAMRLWSGGRKVPLEFPDEVVAAGIDRYHVAFEAIVGMSLAQFQRRYFD